MGHSAPRPPQLNPRNRLVLQPERMGSFPSFLRATLRLMNARLATPFLLSALTLSLTACGNKGPLVLPTQPAPQEAPPTKPGEVPVTISNANDPPVATDSKARSSVPSLPPINQALPPPKTDADKADADPAPTSDKPAEPVPGDGQGDG